VRYRIIKIRNIRNGMKEDWDKSGDIYKEDIVARIKALGISLKKNISLY
jgi:lambda repressor-like predicted transcriptional regulator